MSSRVRLDTRSIPRVAISAEGVPSVLVIDDPAMRRVLDHARAVSTTDVPVLIRGESGTGRSVLARAIHDWGGEPDRPFVTLSCPTLGARVHLDDRATPDVRTTKGLLRDFAAQVESARDGTLLLDEIGELPPVIQTELLGLLPERGGLRPGDRDESAGPRCLVTTGRDLETAVASGQFRGDLLHRINVVELTLPPLRERTDILLIAEELLRAFSCGSDRRIEGFTPEASEAITRYPWPGNVRELSNAVERAAILAEASWIGLADLPPRVARNQTVFNHAVQVGKRVTLEELETEHIRRVLAETESLDEAASVLGIDRSTLYRRRKRLGL
jgi:NtrC-family two-component system response regulator AlgB